MKTLFLLRHAKSSWDHPGLSDFERPLAVRGERAAPRMAAFMKDEGLIPAVVLCSTARRARETWALMEEHLGGGAQVAFLDSLYGAGPGRMLEAARSHAEDRSPVMLVGHNPGMEDLAHALAGSGPETELQSLRRKYPTAGLAVIDIDVTAWSDVVAGLGVLRRFVRPRDLP
jgi:phosphohistidine phosphatase